MKFDRAGPSATAIPLCGRADQNVFQDPRTDRSLCNVNNRIFTAEINKDFQDPLSDRSLCNTLACLLKRFSF